MKIFTPIDIAGMPAKAVRQAYSSMREALNRRLTNMEARGLGTSGAERFPTLRGMTDMEARQALAEASRWARDPRHTVRGETRYVREQIETFHEHGYDFVNKSNYYDFVNYMEELREEYGSKVFDSGDAADVYSEAQRIGIPTETVKKNFDYFADNMKQLKRMKPVRSASGATMGAIKDKIRKLK